MIKKNAVKKSEMYTIDISLIEGDGSFPCPKCGTMISPEDETEDVYKILDTKMVNDELAELVISCGTCRTVIKVVGFQQAMENLAAE